MYLIEGTLNREQGTGETEASANSQTWQGADSSQPNTTEEVENDTTNFSVPDSSLTQKSVELTSETIDIQ